MYGRARDRAVAGGPAGAGLVPSSRLSSAVWSPIAEALPPSADDEVM